MKRLLGFTAVCLMMAALSFAAAEKQGITPQDLAAKPDVYCKVIKDPAPLLMGGWRCVHQRYDKKLHKYFAEPIEYWLSKYGDRYGLYFFRIKADERTYRGWREGVIDGETITSPTGFKISVRNGEVFYHWGSDNPTKMNRIEGNKP